MRLMLWNTNYFRRFGGAERAVHSLLNRFSQLGIDTCLVASRPTPARLYNPFFGPLDPAVDIYQGDFVNPWDSPSTGATLTQFFRYLRAAFRFGLYFRRHRAPIIHLHYVSWDVVLLALCKVLFRYRLVITFRAGEDRIARQNRLSRFKIKIALRYADRATAVSRELCEAIESKYAFAKVLHIPNGLDVERIKRSATPPGHVEPDQFVFCGRMTAQKQVPLLIDAFGDCIQRGCRRKLYLVGDGEELDAIEGLISSRGLQEQIICLGALPHAETLGAIQLSRCLVLSSSFEGSPQVVLEAMALGKAVIASDVGGLKETVVHGQTGYLYPVERQDRLCAFIMELCDDGSRARALGSGGLAKLKADYSLASAVDQYLSLYRSLLSDEADNDKGRGTSANDPQQAPAERSPG